MNIGFVYGGVLVLFDKRIGWFLYDNNNRFVFEDKESIKSFIDKKLIQE
jgi:hypothetical protein